MSNLARTLPHLIMSLSVVTAVSVLAVMGIITGQEALPVIAAAGGFTLGGTSTLLSPSNGTASTAGSSAPASVLLPANPNPTTTSTGEVHRETTAQV